MFLSWNYNNYSDVLRASAAVAVVFVEHRRNHWGNSNTGSPDVLFIVERLIPQMNIKAPKCIELRSAQRKGTQTMNSTSTPPVALLDLDLASNLQLYGWRPPTGGGTRYTDRRRAGVTPGAPASPSRSLRLAL